MSKYKIEIELDIDFQKYFDNIPEGLFNNKEGKGTNDDYELERIYHILSKTYSTALINRMEWMVRDNYKYAEHHLLIDQEISKQIAEKCKVKKIKK